MGNEIRQIPALVHEQGGWDSEVYVRGYNTGRGDFFIAWSPDFDDSALYKGHLVPLVMVVPEYLNKDERYEYVAGWLKAVSKLYVLNYLAREESDVNALMLDHLLHAKNLTKKFNQDTGAPAFVHLKYEVDRRHDIREALRERTLVQLETQLQYELKAYYGWEG